MKCLDVGRGLRIVAERLPENADRFGERRVGDEGVLPDGVDDVLPSHDVASSSNQELQHAQDPRRQRQLSAVPRQESAPRIECKGTEHERRQALTFDAGGRTFGGAHVGKPQCYRGLEKNLRVSYG
jgi:hypothetical protein